MTRKNRQIKPGTGKPEQAIEPVSVNSLSGPTVPIPYLIALTFLAFTALLTLLLTVVMDNKNELYQNITLRNTSPLLTDARTAFGQDEDTTTFHSPLSRESNMLPGDTNNLYPQGLLARSNPASELYFGKKPFAATVNQERSPTTSVSHDIAGSPSDHRETGNMPPVLDSEIAISPQQKDVITTAEPDSGNILHSSTISGAYPLNGAQALDEASTALDKIILAHHNKLSFIRDSISQQTFGQQELESRLQQHISLMEEQIAELTLRVNLEEEVQRVGTAFERVLNKRQGSFERILNRKLNILQRAI